MKEKSKNLINAILIICISVFFIYLIVRYQSFFKGISVRRLRGYIISFGPLAALVFVVMYSLKPLLIVFPAMVFTILAGNIFGPLNGFFLTMVGLFLSGSLAFYLSRRLGKPFVAKITRGKLLKLDENIEVHGFKIMFLMRLSCIFPYDPLSYAAGLTKMRFRDFIIATMLGVFPEMLAYSFLGQSMRHPFSKKLFIPIILVIAIGVLGSFMYKSYNKSTRKNIT
jgi:uncharacterized membrane protein YdjX (TVP38/TMEM64 family)